MGVSTRLQRREAHREEERSRNCTTLLAKGGSTRSYTTSPAAVRRRVIQIRSSFCTQVPFLAIVFTVARVACRTAAMAVAVPFTRFGHSRHNKPFPLDWHARRTWADFAADASDPSSSLFILAARGFASHPFAKSTKGFFVAAQADSE